MSYSGKHFVTRIFLERKTNVLCTRNKPLANNPTVQGKKKQRRTCIVYIVIMSLVHHLFMRSNSLFSTSKTVRPLKLATSIAIRARVHVVLSANAFLRSLLDTLEEALKRVVVKKDHFIRIHRHWARQENALSANTLPGHSTFVPR